MGETLAGALVTADPKSAANWLALQQVGAKADDAKTEGRWDLVDRGRIAAYAAYQLSPDAPGQATALAALGDMYARHEEWRAALDAYRASLQRADKEDVRATYEDMREKHGFRIADYKVDNESASPRVCFTFSDPLARKVDYSPFVAVSGASSTSISAEDQQLCVEGLKHGERYAIVLRQGLPSDVGESLLKNADYEIYVKDRSPQAHFAGKAYVLPRQGQLGAPLTTVNTAKVALEVYRIGDRNLLATLAREDFLKPMTGSAASTIASNDGQKVWSGAMDVASVLNKDVVTDFPILKAVGKLAPGIYVVTAKPWKEKKPDANEATGDASDDADGELATQWMVVSDIGLGEIASPDGLHVEARSLETAAPLADVELRLVAHNNEVLATVKTDAQGRVKFDPGLARGEGGNAPGMVVATLTDDYNFLNLSQPAFDLTDRGVSGRDPPNVLDAFLTTERGVYRPGETVFLTALLRDEKGVAKPGVALTLVVKRPDDVEYKRASVADQGLGGRAFSIPLVSDAAAGKWSVDAFADPKEPAIGHAEFLIEDYQPERIDFTLKPASSLATPGEPLHIALDAKFLYGSPGAGLDVTGSVKLQAVDGAALPGEPGYVAGMVDDEFTAVDQAFGDKVQTDAKGHADVTADLPEGAAPKPLEAKVVVQVAESGGRSVERVVTLPVKAKGAFLGVKKVFGDSLGGGDEAGFDVIAVGPDGKRLSRKSVTWSLYQLTNDYEWFNSSGRWSFEPVKGSKRIADGSINLAADLPASIKAQVGWGSHRLDVKSADGEQTSFTFEVGWGGSASADTPDNVVVTLDKPTYAAGEEAKLSINSRFAGKASIALVGAQVERFIDVDLKEGDNSATFKVGADWGAGAYAVAITHRPLDVKAKRMPGRALGLVYFGIDDKARKLDIALGAPELIRPRGKLSLPVKVSGLDAGDEAEIVVAAVDLGILNLTHFKTPDPGAYFFGQRKLNAEFRDLYGMLIDGMQGEEGALHVGGDGGAQLEGNLPTQPPLALYSGVVKLDADGKATVEFDVPGFNGTVRLMAMAWSKAKVGSAQADVTVRDPVVVTGTLPRFLNISDRSQLSLDIDNVDGAAGDYVFDLDLHGPLSAEAGALTKTVKLAAHQRTKIAIPLAADAVGDAALDLKISGPGFAATQNYVIGVEAGAADIQRRIVKPFAPGSSETISDDLIADLVPGTGSVAVSASPFGALDAPGLLNALDRYPYGCSEQTVSRAMPLLYVNQLASLENLGVDPKLDDRVRAAIDKVMTRQGSNGAFGLWAAGSDDDLWLDAFVADFLTRARERNFAVPAIGFNSALDHLRNTAVNVADVAPDKGEPIAYALYVLARNGRPVAGDLRYLNDTKLDAFDTPLAKAQIAAALAMLGDRSRAAKTFVKALDALESEQDKGVSRPDYGSTLRDAAGVLALASEAKLTEAEGGVQALLRGGAAMEKARAARVWVSTQEMNWLTLAAEGLAANDALSRFTVDGAPIKGQLHRRFAGYAIGKKLVTIANVGKAASVLTTTVSGAPLTPQPAEAHGYQIERSVFNLDGTKADFKSVTQNQRFVVTLKITEPASLYARALVVDRLPAGLEIDNPALFDSGDIENFAWLKQDFSSTHQEYRDDRFVAAFDRDPGQSAFFSVAYVVRAVAPGRYVYPSATVEDMYRPDRYGRTDFGMIEVKAR